jgi:hypothetical protein
MADCTTALGSPAVGQQLAHWFAAWMVLVIAKPNASEVGLIDGNSDTVFLHGLSI